MAAGNGGQKMSQYLWFTVYEYAKNSLTKGLTLQDFKLKATAFAGKIVR